MTNQQFVLSTLLLVALATAEEWFTTDANLITAA